MEQVVVGALLAATIGLGTLYWYLMVLPDVALSFWRDRADDGDDWFEQQPSALRALRMATGGVLLMLGFFTGFALTFLSGTEW